MLAGEQQQSAPPASSSSKLHGVADAAKEEVAAMRRRIMKTTENDTHPPATPLTSVKVNATPPTTPEELDEQLDSILLAISGLETLKERHRYIAKPEVENLRRAYQFAVQEQQRLAAAAAGGGGGGPSSELLPDGCAASSSAEDGGDASRPPRSPVDSRNISKAFVADRRLSVLEAYIAQSPTATSFELSAKMNYFSWRSVFHTPGERRMQSIMISIFNFLTGVPLCLAVFGLLMYCRYTMPLAVVYLFYIFVIDRPTKWPCKKNMRFARHPLFKYYRDYFPVRLVISKSVRRKFDPAKNYLFLYHPHGVHSFGAIMNFGLDVNGTSQLLPGIRTHTQTLKANYYVPFWRELMRGMGVGDASSDCIRKTLRAGPGESVVLVVGGAEESMMAKPHTNDLLLVKRKGFVKIALQEGSPLVPVYGFGENNVYGIPAIANHPVVRYSMALVRSLTGFVVPLVSGRGFFTFKFGLLPHRRPIVVVVGEPLVVPRIANPTQEDLAYWQGEYIKALETLYEAHRGIYDLESTGLRIMK